MAEALAGSNADTAQAGAGAHGATGQDAHTVHDAQFDAGSSRAQDVDKDTGSDERIEVEGVDRSGLNFLNMKRTYDLHQTFDSDAIHAARGTARRSEAYENRAAEATLLHQSKINSQELAERQQDHAQRVRFADSALTVQVGLLTDMAEKLARIERAVCKA